MTHTRVGGCRFVPQLSKKYGPVFTLHFGSERAVVVFGYEVVREVLLNRGDEFTDRGRFPLTEKYKNLGIFMSNGEMWAQTRRFTLTTLRDFGMGKRSVEEWVQEEMGLLLQELEQTKGVWRGRGGIMVEQERGIRPCHRHHPHCHRAALQPCHAAERSRGQHHQPHPLR